jgi:general secretion pathway protein C
MTTAPDKLIQQLGLKSNGPNGGYEVTAATPENLRLAVGLQPGDRIVSVNGQPLGDPMRDRGVLAALRSGNSASVEIQRGSQVVTLERKF